MARYFAWRVVQAVILVFGVLIVNFLLIHLAPGDPISFLSGERADPAFQVRLRHELGLDRSLDVQLASYLSHLFQGDLGYSFTYQEPVLKLILSRATPTLVLMGPSFLLATVLGVGLGVFAAVRYGSWLANLITVSSVVGFSLPSFWLGQVLILLFGVQLQWFPVLGMSSFVASEGVGQWLDLLSHLVLPAATLVAFFVAIIARVTCASMLEVLDQEYLRAARARGLSEAAVVLRHALPNAILPVITVVALQLGSIIGGFVLVETVFSWPGLGRLAFEVISSRDYPVISGLFLVISASIIAANLLADIAYAFADPRVRYA